MKGFKYQLKMKVLLSKQKENGDRKFSTVYFNSIAKTVIATKYSLHKSFQGNFYILDNWINKGIEYIDGENIDISIYDPLSGSTYILLPVELKNSMKSLFNIKSNYNKCFLLCHIRHLKPKTIKERRNPES